MILGEGCQNVCDDEEMHVIPERVFDSSFGVCRLVRRHHNTRLCVIFLCPMSDFLSFRQLHYMQYFPTILILTHLSRSDGSHKLGRVYLGQVHRV